MNELHEVHIDVGCYVADALDTDERAAFEAHLDHCDSCSQEVAEFSETSAELARLVAMAPPRAIRGSMLSAIRSVRPLPPLTNDPQALGSTTAELGPGPRVPTLRRTQEKGRPGDDLAARRSARGGRRNRVLTGLIAAAAVVALALGGFVYSLNQQRQGDFAARTTEIRQNELLSAPDAKIYTASRDGAQYSFVVSKQRNTALFIGTELADLGADKRYQLWTLQGRTALPDALVGASANTQWFEGPITESTSLAITIEPAGGAQQPTPPILAQVRI